MNYAIILAGGKGMRFEGNIPKQFMGLMGEPLLVYSIEAAQESDNMGAVCVVSPKEYYDWVRMWVDKHRITKLLFVAEVGGKRYQSIHSGLKSLPARADDAVITMMTTYPFVSQLAVDKLYEAMETKDACITVIKATDAIISSNNGENAFRTLQKKRLFIQRGPQPFHYGTLEQAYKAYLSDENRIRVNKGSELVLNTGVECDMVVDDRSCIKATYPEDLAIMEVLYPLLIKQETKIGKRM